MPVHYAGQPKKKSAKNGTVVAAAQIKAVPTPKIVEEVKPVTRKVSTGCGPSPPRDAPDTEPHEAVNEIFNEDFEVEETLQKAKDPVVKVSTCVGTSPPPQCAGTQVNTRENKG